MSFKLDMNSDITEIVLYNLRKALSKNVQFSEELLKKIPQALAKFNTRLLTLKEQLSVVQQSEMKRSKQEIERQDYRRVMLIREECKLKIDPLNEKIKELNAFVSEIKDGLKTNEINTRKKVEAEQAQKLEQKRDRYAQEVGIFNGYKVPHELTEAIQTLHKYCRGRTLEDAVQTLILLPERHEELIQLRIELEAENATDGLYDIPELSKELAEMVKYAKSRTESILGYNPQTWKLTFDGYGERGHLTERISAKKRVFMKKKEAKLRRQRENQEAKKQLEAEGLI